MTPLRSVNDSYIGTEHLLLGLIREGDGLAARVPVKLGVDLEPVRREVYAVRADLERPRQVGAAPQKPKELTRVAGNGEDLDASSRFFTPPTMESAASKAAGSREELAALVEYVKAQFQRLVERSVVFPQEVRAFIAVLDAHNPSDVADLVASYLKLGRWQQRQFQEQRSFAGRLEFLSLLLRQEQTTLKMPGSP